jgi:hypothetical protein
MKNTSKLRNLGIAINLLMGILFIIEGNCQDAGKDKVINELRKISERFRNSRYLSFDINYRYASEQKPSVFLDSLDGSFKLSGNKYWYTMADTEGIGNSEYTILLFREDKIMYLSKPSGVSIAQNPIAMIDSFLTARPGIKYSIDVQKKQKKITLEFDGNEKYKKIEYDMDAVTGFITKMSCVVQASEMYDPSVRSEIEDRSVYVVVEADFKNYRENSFVDSLFDTAKYFKKVGEEYIALPPYESYKVFLGTNTL